MYRGRIESNVRRQDKEQSGGRIRSNVWRQDREQCIEAG